MLITKMAECSVRLIRIQNRENAMFNLASSEAGEAEESIKSIYNGSENLTQAVCDAASANWKFNPGEFAKKMIALDEIDCQNLSNISGWVYVEDNMPIAADYIIKKCINARMNLYDFISRETNKLNPRIIRMISAGDELEKEIPLSIEEVVEDAYKLSSSPLQKYFYKLARSLVKDLQVQSILKDLEQRSQQIKDAAIPDTQKLGLIQRYRTADDRQFSKTLGELLELQKRRNSL